MVGYHVLIDKLNSFKKHDDENGESMYSWLNILVNEINFVGVKQIGDTELICKILHSLRRPDYDLVTTIIYEKVLHPHQIKCPCKQSSQEVDEDGVKWRGRRGGREVVKKMKWTQRGGMHDSTQLARELVHGLLSKQKEKQLAR